MDYFQIFVQLKMEDEINTSPKLTKFDMLLILLKKICLSLFDEELAYSFGVHCTTNSRVFH